MSTDQDSKRLSWFRSLLRRRSTWLLLLLAVVCAVSLSFQGPRCCLYGWLRGEPTYQWLPASYWRVVIIDRHRVPTMPNQRSDLPMRFWNALTEWYELRHSLGTQIRHLSYDDTNLVPVILQLLDDDDVQVRAHALALLCWHKEPVVKAHARLQALLHSKYTSDQAGSIDPLAAFGPEARAALPKLRELLEKEEASRSHVQIRAAYAIKRIDPTDQPSIRYLMAQANQPGSKFDRGLSNAHWAMIYLRRLGPDGKDAVPFLIELSRTDDALLAESALHALGNIDPEAAKRESQRAETRE